MMYRKEDKTLGISLDQVKGHSSSGIGNTSDVFINTYLIPDTRFVEMTPPNFPDPQIFTNYFL